MQEINDCQIIVCDYCMEQQLYYIMHINQRKNVSPLYERALKEKHEKPEIAE